MVRVRTRVCREVEDLQGKLCLQMDSGQGSGWFERGTEAPKTWGRNTSSTNISPRDSAKACLYLEKPIARRVQLWWRFEDESKHLKSGRVCVLNVYKGSGGILLILYAARGLLPTRLPQTPFTAENIKKFYGRLGS